MTMFVQSRDHMLARPNDRELLIDRVRPISRGCDCHQHLTNEALDHDDVL